MSAAALPVAGRTSVLIPAYNAQPFIAEALRSVIAQRGDVEIIVVDDGSTDRTAEEAARFGEAVRLIRLPANTGVPTALNRALAAATGDRITILDADDRWEPGWLAAQRAVLTPETPIAWGRARIVFGEAESASPDWPPRHYPQLGSMLFARDVFDRVGAFDERQRHAHDIDFLARCAEAGVASCRHEGIVLCWRRHDRNISNQIALDRDYLVTAVRGALDRRRATASS